MARLRWSKSLHSQIKTIFSVLKAFGVSKVEALPGQIRSIGTWNAYLREAHSFGRFLIKYGVSDLRDVQRVAAAATQYLAWRLQNARDSGQSLHTQESRSAALGALERAFNTFFANKGLPDRLDLSAARHEYLALSREYLGRGREYLAGTRAYFDAEKLIATITNEAHRLQAQLQYEGGFRAEGVGAPSGAVNNPLTLASLKGLGKDPVTGHMVGCVTVREKGGKWTMHYIPHETYVRLTAYLEKHGALQSRYSAYRDAILLAAKMTGQYAPGRGTHGLKTSFAQRRYAECVRYGFSHERALQQTALELAHNRAEITLIYTKG